MERDFKGLVSARWDERKFLCVGLDSDFEKLPEHLRALGPRKAIVEFNRQIIEATKDLVCAYKPNSAFYEAHGAEGWLALSETSQLIHDIAPDVPVILDAKRADIGNTNSGYVTSIFDTLGMDAVTVHPYLGAEALKPFLDRSDKGIIVLCHTSNPGSVDFQELVVGDEPLYIRVARNVAESWNQNGNCSLVVGASFPEQMAQVRKVAPELPFLIPGIGTQGGDLEASVKAGKDSRGKGMIINASRSLIFASPGEDFAQVAREKAQEYHGAISKALS